MRTSCGNGKTSMTYKGLKTHPRIVFLVGLLTVFLWYSQSAAAQSETPARPPYEEVTVAAGIAGPRAGNEKITGQAWGDYDGDGWVDLYLTDFGLPLKPGPNRLLRNNGDGTFSPSPVADQVALADVKSSSAAWPITTTTAGSISTSSTGARTSYFATRRGKASPT